MYFSGKELERMLYILGVFAGDLEVRLCKNCTVIFSFSRSIERCSFYCIYMKSKIRPSWYAKGFILLFLHSFKNEEYFGLDNHSFFFLHGKQPIKIQRVLSFYLQCMSSWYKKLFIRVIIFVLGVSTEIKCFIIYFIHQIVTLLV